MGGVMGRRVENGNRGWTKQHTEHRGVPMGGWEQGNEKRETGGV